MLRIFSSKKDFLPFLCHQFYLNKLKKFYNNFSSIEDIHTRKEYARRFSSRRSSQNMLGKHKSAPLVLQLKAAAYALQTNMSMSLSNNSACQNNSARQNTDNSLDVSSSSNMFTLQPFNDISNHGAINLTSWSSIEMSQLSVRLSSAESSAEIDTMQYQSDEMQDLYSGNLDGHHEGSLMVGGGVAGHHQFIEASLKLEEKCKNLIGDKSRKHLLPYEEDRQLCSISPDTVSIWGKKQNKIDVLLEKYK